MAEILRFVTVDRNDVEGETEYATEQEAIDAAGEDCAVIMRTYTYEESELVWTPDGSDRWPPKPKPAPFRGFKWPL